MDPCVPGVRLRLLEEKGGDLGDPLGVVGEDW